MKKVLYLSVSIMLSVLYNNNLNAQSISDQPFCGTPGIIDGLLNKDPQTLKFIRNKTAEARNKMISKGHYVYPTAHFDVIYSDSGADSVSQTDNDLSGYPDFVEYVANAAESAYTFFVNHAYTIPPHGYYAKYRIYIDTIHDPNELAYTYPDTVFKDNPFSAVVEDTVGESIIVIRQDLSSPNLASLIYTVIGHEYFHEVAFGYNIKYTGFFHESNASFHQTYMYPSNHFAYGFLNRLFNNPDLAVYTDHSMHYSGYVNAFEYSAWLFTEYLSEHTDTNFCKNLLEQSLYTHGRQDELAAYKSVLGTTYEITLPEMFGNFAVANLLMTNTPAYQPFTYKDGYAMWLYLSTNNGINRIKTEDTLHYNGTNLHYSSSTGGNSRLMRMSADYIRLESSANFGITLMPVTPNPNLMVYLCCYNSSSVTWNIVSFGSKPNGSKYMVNIKDHGNWNYYYIVVARVNEIPADTLSIQYTIDITPQLPWLFYNQDPYYVTGAGSITDILVAQDNTVYAAAGFGVTRLNSFWRKIDKWASYLAEDAPGNVWWIDGNGVWLKKYSGGAITTFWDSADVKYKIPGMVLSLAADGSGNILIAGANKVRVFDGSTTDIHLNYTSPSDNANDMKVTPSNNIWIATNYGVGRSVGGGAFNLLNTSNGLPDDVAYGVGIAPDGTPWFGTNYGGLAFYNGTALVRVDTIYNHFYAVYNRVFDIEFDPSGRMWVATSIGLFKFEGPQWTVYNTITAPDMTSDYILCIDIDDNGCVWMGTLEGVQEFCDPTLFTGVPQQENNTTVVDIFPNPANEDFVNITTANTMNKSAVFQLYDITGRLIIEQPLNGKTTQINLKNTLEGVYTYRVISGNEKPATGKLAVE